MNAIPKRGLARVKNVEIFSTGIHRDKVYSHADLVGSCIVFNVGGNNYRIIAAIHFNTQTVFILHVLTHPEYDRGKWKSSCECD